MRRAFVRLGFITGLVVSCSGGGGTGGGNILPDDGGAGPLDASSGDGSAGAFDTGVPDTGKLACPILPLTGPGTFAVPWAILAPDDLVASVRDDGSGNTYAVITDASVGWDFTLLKLDSSGKVLWKKIAGGVKNDAGREGRVYPASVVVDASGAAIVVGNFTFSTSFGGTILSAKDAGNQAANALFFMKVSPDGNTVTTTKIDAVNTWVKGAAIDTPGHLWITGGFAASNVSANVDLGGGPLTKRGGDDIFVLELDDQVRHVSSRSYGSTGDDVVAGIAVRSGGGVVIAGALRSGSGDIGNGPVGASTSGGFLAAYTTANGYAWSVLPLSIGAASDVAIDKDGNVIVVGGTPSTVAALGPSGSPSWSTAFDPALHLSRIAASPTGGLAAAGTADKGTFMLAGTSVTAASAGTPGVLVRLTSTGTPNAARLIGGGCAGAPYLNSAVHALGFGPSGRLVAGGVVTGNVDFGLGPTLYASGNAVLFGVLP